MKTETQRTTEGKGFILNTFEDLEGPILDQIRKHIPNMYSIGPLHAHLRAHLESKGVHESSHRRSSSFWEEDHGCMAWLDSQPSDSVIYVSFGSKVLAHRAIGVFFTHSGWNSTMENQTTNSRFVSEVWRIGLDMKDTCDRDLIEKMVRDVMEVRRDEFLEGARCMATLARKAIAEGGSSYLNLNRLIEFLKSTVSRV
ncbi:7-deoxyloganetic acid glucosyltransferase [Phtheirospermum japonicum]|uniref:7-deoxyloganetic acid glucosyltransferase n=1 Tax=Phtheirospermum japonicum TaxID=374723 RepID=A0A830BLJ1_9LAMI|nr:7-deoxyloganetic acid glucosyltransferase [Phtheirospermum japonicum]